MPELSNLLRQRLAATDHGGAPVHPDADTLTAYVEHSLPAAERQTVVSHLVACEPCREVVALSQPELPELVTQRVIRPAPVSGWRRLFTPSFGLAASVAAMAVIAILVLQLSQRTLQPTAPDARQQQQAKVAPAGEQKASAEAKEPLSTQPAETAPASAAVADRFVPPRAALGH
ncbi:MAG: zf-HC2 domain-containing protein, partial [Terriglobales bacterium]